MKKTIKFDYEIFAGLGELNEEDQKLLMQARIATEKAYAPYSQFHVGAVAMLANGAIVAGANQENAAFPAGICAERTLLSSAAILHPGVGIKTLAISYKNHNEATHSDVPITPCGICRQSLTEYEGRTGAEMRILLSGMTGEVLLIKGAGKLLPLSFSSKDMEADPAL